MRDADNCGHSPRPRCCARVRGCIGQISGTSLRHVDQDGERLAQCGCIVDVGRAMQRDDAEAARRIDEAAHRSRRWPASFADATARLRCWQQRIDHDVADEPDALRGDAFAQQIVGGRALRCVKTVGDLVGEHPVDFLGHGAIEAAQSGFDVNDANPLS